MSSNFRCDVCGDAAVTALIYDDGSERMYCAGHIHEIAPNDPLGETMIDTRVPQALAPAPELVCMARVT
jgi:hypothetical protein